MTPRLLDYLCDPITKQPLRLVDAVMDGDAIESGFLVSPDGVKYPVIRGIPRFVDCQLKESVDSFGDEWNHFNFTEFKINWLQHTVKNTFGSVDAFRGKVIVDAGGGSGAQSMWFLESGAEYVILLELSHSVDDVVTRNIDTHKWKNFDVVQCSIDQPPIKDESISGFVYCHNVIQHTPSVEKTAHALYRLAAKGGEFVFNCYQKNDEGIIRWVRFHCIYQPMRLILSRLPFWAILMYARMMGVLRLIPVLGIFLDKTYLCGQGDVPIIPNESTFSRLKRRFRATCLNTFDAYGSHTFQHHKSDTEIRDLLSSMRPEPENIGNLEAYFRRPPPIGCALRVQR